MTKRTTLTEYQQVAQAVIDFITTKNAVTATEIEQHFPQMFYQFQLVELL